jgi:TrpR-related protein YerC/YecD
MAKTERRARKSALYETILKLKDEDECRRFFEDLCTPVELRSMEQRFDVAVYLQQGKVYLEILEKTGASSATISRVRRSMLDNGAGGVMREVILREGLGREDAGEIEQSGE